MKCFFLLMLLVFGGSNAATGQESLPATATFDKNVKILYKPRPSQGDGQDCSQGTVILRVEFLASGKIGQISVVKGLTDNRTAESLKAGQTISFRPAKKDGKNITIFRMVAFSFESH